ncbi:MAG TPA: DUF488 domain-containing protein [Fibrobacteria bacterium]|nr:DUF488 domain-containing protein [Fibrobacteria bacterium]
MKIYTIGFTKKSAESFFTKIRSAGAKRLIDVRLNNVSQLAGFSKRDDLRFFTREICKAEYLHLPDLAPTQDILDAYKKEGGDWSVYEKAYLNLISSRKIEENISPNLFENACLLCSEDKPHHCHRRLVAEYLKTKWKDVQIEHIA